MKPDKLVRDRIPELIRQRGGSASVRELELDEYIDALRKKLSEEMLEFYASSHIEELVDILEVVYALAAIADISPQELEQLRQTKAETHGSFDQRLLLVAFDDPLNPS